MMLPKAARMVIAALLTELRGPGNAKPFHFTSWLRDKHKRKPTTKGERRRRAKQGAAMVAQYHAGGRA